MGEPRCTFAGNMATPRSSPTLPRRSRKLPLVVQIIAALPSANCVGVVPHSTTPAGCAPSRFDRSTQKRKASITAGWSNDVFVPVAFISEPPLAVTRPWKSQ